MRITVADMGALPLPAAWMEGDTVVASTPEWQGPAWGMREYRAGRRLRLLVAPGVAQAGIRVLCDRVLLELGQAVFETRTDRRAGVRLSVAALAVVTGRGEQVAISEAEVAAAVTAACAMETAAPRFGTVLAGTDAVAGGWLVAAAMKQLAVNAARHEGCVDAVGLRVSARGCWLRWEATSTAGSHALATSRHPGRRAGWGLGMVRLACDALGATHLAPHEVSEGLLETSFVLEPESVCLRLPLATVSREGVVLQATRTWDAEAGLSPGRHVRGEAVAAAVAAAWRAAGHVVQAGPWAARADGDRVWVALRPADAREEGMDLLQGMEHEAELLVGEPGSGAWVRAVGAVEALSLALGRPAAGWSAREFRRDVARYGDAYGVDLGSLGEVTTPAPPPALTAFVLAAGGGGWLSRVDGGWAVHVRAPEAAELAGLAGGDGVVRIPVVVQDESSSLQEVG